MAPQGNVIKFENRQSRRRYQAWLKHRKGPFMNINFRHQPVDLVGKAILGRDNKPATLGHICCEALALTYRQEGAIDGQEKYNRGALARKIHESGGTCDLNKDEVALCKKVIGMAYDATLVVQACWDALNASGTEITNPGESEAKPKKQATARKRKRK